MARITYFVSRDTVSVHLEDGTTGVVRLDSPHANDLREILNKGTYDDVDVELVRDIIDTTANLKKQLAAVATGDLVFTGDDIQFRGQSLNLEAARRVVELAQNGFAVDRFMKFLNKLINNPYPTAVNELWQFMEASQLPINEDGDLIAYKIVRSDYMDHYSRSFDNSIGKSPEVKPFEVDPDRNNTCSRGLHVCGKDYLPHYGTCTANGDRIMIVSVDPSQVVAVPTDYKFHKMRVWKYTVIGEMEGREKAGILEKRGVFNTGDGQSFINYGDSLSDDQRAAAMADVDGEGWSASDNGGTWSSSDIGAAWASAVADNEAEDESFDDGDMISDVAAAQSTSFFIQDEFDEDKYLPASIHEVREAMSGTVDYDVYAFVSGSYVKVTNNV